MKAWGFSIMFAAILSSSSGAATIHVPEDLPTIGFAVWFADDGDEIIVGPGVYTEDDVETMIDLEGKSIWIRSSDGPEVTIIDGEGLRRGVLFQSGEGGDSIIEGFTFRDCTAPWYDWNENGQQDSWEYFGGAIWCRDGSSPTIRSCHFVNGSAEYGGAICCFDEFFSTNEPLIENCRFIGNNVSNGVGGALYSYSGSPTVLGCDFIDNTAGYGGAILNVAGSNPVITECLFENNSASLDAGAIYNDASMPSVSACVFINNTADDDGGAVFNADPAGNQNVPVFLECDFKGNVAGDEGGAIANFSVSPEISTCLISGNTASEGGGMHSWNSSQPVLSGNLICGNLPTQIYGSWLDDGDNEILDECPQDCPDATGDGVVDVNDVLAIIGAYESDDSNADVDGSGFVDANDILAVLAGWGICE